jgi:DNA-binding NarL/FixJ family response regulator
MVEGDARRDLPGGLTERQAAILRRVTSGDTNRAIASQLGIDEPALAKELETIFRALDVSTPGQAAAVAVMKGVA